MISSTSFFQDDRDRDDEEEDDDRNDKRHRVRHRYHDENADKRSFLDNKEIQPIKQSQSTDDDSKANNNSERQFDDLKDLKRSVIPRIAG